MLSAPVKPRALWVAAHHLELSTSADGLWAGLLEALAELVSGSEADSEAARCGGCLMWLPVHLSANRQQKLLNL